MNKAFEKILERLDELIEKSYYSATEGNRNAGIKNSAYHKVKKIVQEVAEEYNGGWIPCSERLPDDFMSMEYLTTVKGHFYPEINYYCVANHKWFSSRKNTKEVDVIAWQPLPERFKERD